MTYAFHFFPRAFLSSLTNTVYFSPDKFRIIIVGRRESIEEPRVVSAIKSVIVFFIIIVIRVTFVLYAAF